LLATDFSAFLIDDLLAFETLLSIENCEAIFACLGVFFADFIDCF